MLEAGLTKGTGGNVSGREGDHGVLAVGETVEAAYDRADGRVLRAHPLQARNVGEPKVLPDEAVDTLRERFANNGQNL